MKLQVRIGGRTRSVEVTPARLGSPSSSLRFPSGPPESGREPLLVRLDGRTVEADAVEVAPGTYSILLDGQSFEVRVQPAEDGVSISTSGEEFSAQVLDPRAWRGKRGGVLEAEGRQQITAPMPGKVVRVLVAVGDAVEAGQGLLVVEAMKMQNEIRSPKTGKVERLRVTEGQAVNAGDVLVVVT